MKKRKRLTLDRTTIRSLTPAQTQEAAGGWFTTLLRCQAPTLNDDETCYSCDATWCNRGCSMWACPPPY